MTRAESVHTRGSEAIHSPNTDDTGTKIRFRTTTWPAIFLLVCAGACLGASGPGIGFKAGVQTLEDPIDLEKTTRARFELEVSSAMLLDDHLDLAFTFGGLSLGSLSDDYVDVVDGALIERSYTDDFSLLDIRLAARLYPLGSQSRIRPYVGAGIGYFWFIDCWEDEYSATMEDPLFPGTFITIAEDDEGTDTVAQGLFPFVTAGLTLPIGSHAELTFEFQYDFDKEDSGFDLGGPIYMLGGRFRF
jgi:hypothetical protein